MPKAAHFGAGNIGRGFVGQLYFESHYDIVFLDVVDDLVKALTEHKTYRIKEADPKGSDVRQISNYKIIHSDKNKDDAIHEIATAEIVSCSVGPNILKFIAPTIAKAIEARDIKAHPKPLAVIACENAILATNTLKGLIEDKLSETAKKELAQRAEFANCAIDRIVPTQPKDAGVDITIEKHFEWAVEETPFSQGPPKIAGVHWVKDVMPYLERKLWTINTGHATTAYFGHAAGKTTIRESLEDPAIKEAVKNALSETSALIQKKHGFSAQEQTHYIDLTLSRFANPKLDDACVRVGRNPLRKLSRDERYIRPASLCAEDGLPVKGLLAGMAKALKFQDVKDDTESFELAKKLKSLSAHEATAEITNLPENHPLFAEFQKIVEAEQKS